MDENVERSSLVELRRLKNLTQEDVAKELGVTTRTIINWENGHHEPRLTIRQTKRLCELFELQIADLPDDFGPNEKADMPLHIGSVN